MEGKESGEVWRGERPPNKKTIEHPNNLAILPLKS